jgi:phi13 family phage major tail protein
MATANKVKYNLKNVHVAKATIADDGTATYDTPFAVPGAVSISLEAQGDTASFYADGIKYYVTTANNGYEGDLEVAMLPEKFLTDILGNYLDDSKVLIEDADAKPVNFAITFEFDGDINQIKHVLYNCVATRPSIASQTKEDSVEVQTMTTTLTCSTIVANGKNIVKGMTVAETDAEAYEGWHTAIHVPTVTA